MLQCDCVTHTFCRGTFAVSFDGVFSTSPIDVTVDDGSAVVSSLNAMETVTNAGLTVSVDSTVNKICATGFAYNHTFYFDGPLG